MLEYANMRLISVWEMAIRLPTNMVNAESAHRMVVRSTARDGKAVAVSPSPPKPRGGKEALDHVKRRATYWKETVEWMRKMEVELGNDRVLTVRYEDLCKDGQSWQY